METRVRRKLPTAKIKINGELSDAFKLERSTRQGWPLAQRIRQKDKIKGINIAVLKEYGSYSGYKLNIQNTQAGRKKIIKYLGVNLSMDISLEEINYSPLKKDIMVDISRRSLTAYLVDTIKMNMLPKVLYLFQSVSIENPDRYFVEWDRILSRFIWAGKKPRVKNLVGTYITAGSDRPITPDWKYFTLFNTCFSCRF
uniref:Reverse transcriptase domain-containing protein n=1 Tax=Pundamilia nyererei TaxID=303518 RepID=A0A3B4G892_9CICH